MEDKRKRCVALKIAVKRMLKHLEDSEEMKVSLGELVERASWKRCKKQVFLSCRLPNRQGMREAKSSSDA